MAMVKEKINLLLFYCELRTGHFGAGTHINVLLPFLKSQPDIVLTIIKTDLRGQPEVSFTVEEDIIVISIPQPENKLYLHAENNSWQQKYAERITDIISPVLAGMDRFTIWVNSIDYLHVVGQLKNRFPEATLLYVHHAWSWKCYLNIPDDVFTGYWKSTQRQLGPPAFEYTCYQQELAQCADMVVTVTQQAKFFFHRTLGLPLHKIKTIYNGIEEPPAKVLPGDTLRAKYGFGTNEQIILFSGRVKKEKGLGWLLGAFKNLALRNKNIRLVIAGYGDFAEFIEMAGPCWSKVVFTGELSSDELRELYCIASIGVLPSLFEQCSFTAIEMRFYRLPLIVSDVDGLGEVFEDGSDALVVPVSLDADGTKKLEYKPIEEAMHRLLGNEALRNQLAANGLKKAKALFSAGEMQNSYLQTIRALYNRSEPVRTDTVPLSNLNHKTFQQGV